MIFTIRSLIVPTGAGAGAAAGAGAGGWAAAAAAPARRNAASRRTFRMPGIIRAHSMSLLPFVQWLADTPGSIALRESVYTYPLVESAHVLTLCIFLGLAVMWDLRLLGITLTKVAASGLKQRLGPWITGGFVVMVITGVLLFYAIPVRSYQSLWFRMKAVALVLAGLNAFVFHRGIDRRIEQWDRDPVPPRAARLA